VLLLVAVMEKSGFTVKLTEKVCAGVPAKSWVLMTTAYVPLTVVRGTATLAVAFPVPLASETLAGLGVQVALMTALASQLISTMPP
jgi:hypothetical protein